MNAYFWFSFLVAANSLLLLALAMNVSWIRIKDKVSLGDGGNKKLMVAIRAHANSVEQFPIYALSMLALGFLGEGNATLSVLAIGFTIARLSHAAGMILRIVPARRLGAGFTYVFHAVAIASIGARMLA